MSSSIPATQGLCACLFWLCSCKLADRCVPWDCTLQHNHHKTPQPPSRRDFRGCLHTWRWRVWWRWILGMWGFWGSWRGACHGPVWWNHLKGETKHILIHQFANNWSLVQAFPSDEVNLHDPRPTAKKSLCFWFLKINMQVSCTWAHQSFCNAVMNAN